jgi:hypothetical protein
VLCAQVKEASKVYGVTTLEHPAVQMISMERGKYYLGGKVQVRVCVFVCMCVSFEGVQVTCACVVCVRVSRWG